MEIKDKKCKEPKIRCVANANEGVSNHNPWHYSEKRALWEERTGYLWAGWPLPNGPANTKMGDS